MSILVTGGSGMLGRALEEILPEATYLSSRDTDLTNPNEALKIFEEIRPSQVIHLAASVGGVKANRDHNVEFFTHNLKIDANVLRAAVTHETPRLLALLSGCAYAFYEDRVTFEEDLHEGLPFEGNLGYGYAKRVLDVHCQLIRRQYQWDYETVTPVTMFGPHDNFDLEEGHVIGALIHKCLIAKETSGTFNIWGDGSAVRQFVYAGDVARLLVDMVGRQKSGNVIIAPDEGIRIRDLAEKIAELIHFDGPIEYDDSRPVGLQKKVMQSKRFSETFPAFRFTPIDESLALTLQWFRESWTHTPTGTTES